MAPQEKTEVVQNLERSRQEFLDAVEGLSESDARHRPDPERWSVLDCVEHVAFVEERFLGWLDNAERSGAPPADKAKEGDLMSRVPDRTTRVKAPDAVIPNGRFATLQEAVERFEAMRARSIQVAHERGDELYSLSSKHPRFGPINGVELMIIIAGHARRHAEQIRETRAAFQKALN